MDDKLIAVLIGGLIAAIPTIITTVLNNREAKRRAFDSAAIALAEKAWENHVKMAEQYSAAGYRASVGDIQSYVLYSLLVMDRTSRGRMNKKHARKELEEIHEVMAIMDEFQKRRVSGEIKKQNKSEQGDA